MLPKVIESVPETSVIWQHSMVGLALAVAVRTLPPPPTDAESEAPAASQPVMVAVLVTVRLSPFMFASGSAASIALSHAIVPAYALAQAGSMNSGRIGTIVTVSV